MNNQTQPDLSREELAQACEESADFFDDCDRPQRVRCLRAAARALRADPDGSTVRIPTSADEAALMALLGTNYLKDHAPDRLRADPVPEVPSGGRGDVRRPREDPEQPMTEQLRQLLIGEFIKAQSHGDHTHALPFGARMTARIDYAQSAADQLIARLREAGLCVVPEVPTEDQWGGDSLARTLMRAFDMGHLSSEAIMTNLQMSGWDIPEWLANELGPVSTHVLPKASRCVLIYRAMIDALPERPAQETKVG